MRIDLSGKSAIVTGSTAGIGLACVKRLAENGASVVLNGRTNATVDRACAAVTAAVPGAQISRHTGDLGTAQGYAALMAAHPACDILVNNLDIYSSQNFFGPPDGVWNRFFEVNVMSSVRLSRAYLPGMAQEGWGRVVFIVSESAMNTSVDMTHYHFRKNALLSISRELAKRMVGSGVTVNAVLPSSLLPNGAQEEAPLAPEAAGAPPEQLASDVMQAQRPSSKTHRELRAEEIASMVVYACSPQAAATTGAALRVDDSMADCL